MTRAGAFEHVTTFEVARPRLLGLAYRMLGVVVDAEDVVQDTWLRWDTADRVPIENPDAWLTTVASRLALDRLRRRKREQDRYVGPWLPEPIVTAESSPSGDPEASAELADSLTLGFLTMLEALSPDERAVLLLVEVFGEPYSTVAATLDRTDEACRQLATRARRKLRRDASAPAPASRDVIERFLAAIVAGDERTALLCVHPDIDLVSDGGGQRHAARRPVVGDERVVRFLINLARRVEPGVIASPASVGGLDGVVVREEDGTPMFVMSLEVDGDRIRAIRTVLNPTKLHGLELEPGNLR